MAKQSTTTRKQAGSQRPKKRKAESATSQNGQDVSSFEQELAEYLQERIKPGLNSGAIPLLARSIAKDIARRQSSEDAENGDDVDDDSTEAEADEDQVQAEADDTDVDDTEDDDTEAEADDDEAEAEADYDEEAEADDDTEAEADDDYDEADDDTEAAADDDYEDEDEDAAETNGNGSTDFEAAMRELQGELGDDWILRFSVQGDESWLTAEKDDGSQRVQAATASVLSEVVELLNEDG